MLGRDREWPRRPDRRALLRRLIAAGAVRTEGVARAFAAVPRHVFLPTPLSPYAYRDTSLTVRDGHGRRLAVASAPSQVARVAEALEIEPGMRVLQIGSGTGFTSAVFKNLVGGTGEVTVLEPAPAVIRWARPRLARVAPGVRLRRGERVASPWLQGPFDRIWIRRSHADFPAALDDLVPPGGRLAMPFSWVSPLQGLIAVFEREEPGWKAVAWLDGQGDPTSPFPRAVLRRGTNEASHHAPVEPRAGFWVSVPALPPEAQEAVWSQAVATRPDRCSIALGGAVAAVDWRGLSFWLALHVGERLFMARPGSLAGVVTEDGSGAAVGRDGTLRAWGDRPPIAEIEAIIEGWVRAGRPPLERFDVSVRRRDACRTAAGPEAAGPRPAAPALRWLSLRADHAYEVTLPLPGPGFTPSRESGSARG